MKQKRTTLRKFIETFPVASFIKDEQPFNFKEKSYEELYDLYMKNITWDRTVLSIKDGHVYYIISSYRLTRKGNRFYKSLITVSSIYIDSKSVKLKNASERLIVSFLKLIGINWFRDIKVFKSYCNRSSIIKGIIIKSIYNEETFYKAVASRVWNIKGISWRNVKRVCNHIRGIPIYDCYYFTKNINDTIERFFEADNYSLLYDTLTSAVKLNQIIDFKWSDKRFEEEHKKQIQILMERELSKKDDKPIYEHVINTDTIKLLNTEKDIFLEGKNMHHCLYTNYYHRIKEKKYIAFHMTYPEDCTFSIRVCGTVNNIADKLIFDQIYLKYDRSVKPETRDVAVAFMHDHNKELCEMFNEKMNILEETSKLFEPLDDFELIF